MKNIEKNRPLEIGTYLKDRNFGIINNLLNKNKKINCSEFPIVLSGCCGSGKTETAIQLTMDMIKNDEGFIFIDNKGDVSIYMKMFSNFKNNNKLDDLYLLNFLAKDLEGTHTIDIINPTIGNEFFNIITGDVLFKLINSICLSMKNNNILVEHYDLKSFTSLDYLTKLLKNNIYEKSFDIINEYLNDLDYYANKEMAIKQHAMNSLDLLDFIESYENNAVNFSINPTLSIKDVVNHNKSLLILNNSLEKDVKSINIFKLIYKTCEQLLIEKNSYYLIVDDLYSSYEDRKYLFDNLDNLKDKKIIYIYQNLNFKDSELLIEKLPTIIFMKHCDKPEKKFIESLENKLNKDLNIYMKSLSYFQPGEAYVFKLNDNKNQVIPLNFTYKSINLAKYIHLNKKPIK